MSHTRAAFGIECACVLLMESKPELELRSELETEGDTEALFDYIV